VEPDRSVDRLEKISSEPACRTPPTRDGPDLLGLGLRVTRGLATIGGEQHLERMDPTHVGGRRQHRDHPSSQTLRRGVRAVVADDDHRTGACRMCGPLLARAWAGSVNILDGS